MKKEGFPEDLIQAEHEFATFLKEQGFHQKIVWVSNEMFFYSPDAINYRYYDKLLESLNEIYIKHYADNGVEIQGIAFDDEIILTQLCLPKNEEIANELQIPKEKIKFSMVKKTLKIKLIKSSFKWKSKQTMNKKLNKQIKKNDFIV